MKILKSILGALTVYLLTALLSILLLSFIACKSNRGTELIGIFNSIISFIIGFAFTAYLRKSGIEWQVSLICVTALLAVSALCGLAIGILNTSGALSTVMFTVSGCAVALILPTKSRKRSTRLKSLHKL